MILPGALAPSPADEVARLRRFFTEGGARTIRWRREQLAGLRTLLADNASDLLDAMASDLGRPTLEGWITDVWLVDREIALLRRRVRRWSRSHMIRVPIVSQPGHARVRRVPYGVSLIVAPWNYPIQLTLLPLAAALAAGNCVVVKPSEHTPAVGGMLAELLPRYCSPEAVSVVLGAALETRDVIAAPVDHVFFTGSAVVGRKILEAAAPQLTPVTLELGGKSPAIVARDADLTVAARRIVFGKFLNAGQSCVAPDYVLVESSVTVDLVRRITTTIAEFFGSDPEQSLDYARIANLERFERLRGWLASSDGEVIGAEMRESTRYIEPTLVLEPSPTSPLMTEEIFGPILPVISVTDISAAVAFIEDRAAPLAVYCFTRSRATARRVEGATTSGTFCQNTTVEQLAIPGLAFGGVGASGSGSYHGRFGFETFTRTKAILVRRTEFDLGLAEPPYTEKRRRRLAVVLRRPKGTMPTVTPSPLTDDAAERG